MDAKYNLMQELKKNHYNDFVVLFSYYDDFKFWIFSDYKDARKKYNQVKNSSILDAMPSTLQIHLLN